MKNPLPLTLLLVGAGVGVACTTARAEGDRRTEPRPVSGFSKVDVSGGITLRIERGERHQVLVTAAPEVLEKVRTEKDGDTLEIDTKGLRWFGDPDVEVTLVMPKLEGLELSGAVEATVRDVRAPRLEVEGSGASHLVLSGVVDHVVYELSGASKVDALALTARSVVIDASGATRAKVRAESSLEADASGATHIRYAGEPAKVKTDLSGASRVERI